MALRLPRVYREKGSLSFVWAGVRLSFIYRNESGLWVACVEVANIR